MEETLRIVNIVMFYWFLPFANFSHKFSNKFFDSLSAGKPIIVNSNGWTKDIVETYQCGYYVDATKPKSCQTFNKDKISKEELSKRERMQED